MPSILPTGNWYTSTKDNYTAAEKKFTENLLLYWTNFVIYNDPNYRKTNNDIETWLPFTNSSKILEKANASIQLMSARYLVFDQNKMFMTSDFSTHNCDLWGYTNNSVSVCSNVIFYFFTFLFCYYIIL
jgi:hypothetical protein